MDHLSINKKEVLRYLGYDQQRIGTRLSILMEECIEEVLTFAQPRSIYKLFNIKRQADQLWLEQTTFNLLGQDIAKHLKQATTCIIMALTLGTTIDTRIRYYEKFNLTKALILDACASVGIEEAANQLCSGIESELKVQDKQLTSRYSPGYGDFPLEVQKQVISILNADRSIGLNVSSHSILIPRKSITAIAGVVDKTQIKQGKNCLNCKLFSDCQFRKDQDRDGC